MTKTQKKETKIKESEENEKSLDKELENCEKQKAEYLAGWQRAQADFSNYKKEEIERVKNLAFYIQEEIILKILEILDNFDRAEKNTSEILENDFVPKIKNSIDGFLQIKTQIKNFLKSYDVEEIKSIGEKFDPNFHEVIEEINTKDKESGIIIKEIQKGYSIHGKILRAAKVKVAK